MVSEVKNMETGLAWRREILVKGDHLQHISSFTAMQKATAFPAASVASLMAEGKLEGDKDQRRDYYTQYPKSLTYKDIPTELFNDNLKKLNIL
jgi:saccharopine dehydrogenase-like NADP-dependent oxidoreductase